jgi:hypothetical protein
MFSPISSNSHGVSLNTFLDANSSPNLTSIRIKQLSEKLMGLQNNVDDDKEVTNCDHLFFDWNSLLKNTGSKRSY